VLVTSLLNVQCTPYDTSLLNVQCTPYDTSLLNVQCTPYDTAKEHILNTRVSQDLLLQITT